MITLSNVMFTVPLTTDKLTCGNAAKLDTRTGKSYSFAEISPENSSIILRYVE